MKFVSVEFLLRVCSVHVIHSFYARFSSGWDRGTAALGGLEIPHGQQQSMIFLLLHSTTGPSKVGDTVSRRWTTSGTLSGATSARSAVYAFCSQYCSWARSHCGRHYECAYCTLLMYTNTCSIEASSDFAQNTDPKVGLQNFARI